MRILGGKELNRRVAFGVIATTALGMFCTPNQAALFQRNGINWNTNITEAAALAKQHNKPMLLKVSTDWCGYCKKMQRETFSDANVIARVNEGFIPVYVDGDKNKALVKRLGVRSYPTTVIVSPNQQVLANITGFRSAQQLSSDLARFSPSDRQEATSNAIVDRRQPRPSVFGENCPVSPIETGKFVPASSKFGTTFRGYRINFASREYLQAFSQNPTKYWPVADGMCVVSAAEGQGPKMGQLNNGAVYQGRIWFFANHETRTAFESEPAKYLNWYKQRAKSIATKQRTVQPRRQ